MSILELTIDVETIPTQSQVLIDSIDIKCPGNIKKPDSVQKWRDETRPGLIENAVRKTSLDSTKGELIVIGWAINDGAPECVYRDYRDKTQTEADLLQGFYDAIFRHFEAGYYDTTLWIGHNILSFDLPYLWHRSKINGIKSTVRLPYNARPWSESIFDT
ncbi:MAG: 3'-5' exonuclease, partial [Thiohalomonadales bacterium]